MVALLLSGVLTDCPKALEERFLESVKFLALDRRAPFFVYVDEFQSFSTDAFASLLSEARKFATHFSLANQYTEQLSDEVRAAVLGNAGTLMVFRVSAEDARLLAPEFHPLSAHELVDQSPYRAYLRRGDSGHRAVFVSPRHQPANAIGREYFCGRG